MDYTNLIVSIPVGAALVILIDGIRYLIPTLSDRAVKAITIALTIVFAIIIYLSDKNTNVEQGLTIFLNVLGTSQGLYGLIWKNTAIHQSIAGDGVEPTK